MVSTRYWISWVASFTLVAKRLTSSETVLNPCPCSPALDASIEALKANTLVFSEIEEIIVTICEISWEDSANFFSFLAVPATEPRIFWILLTVWFIAISPSWACWRANLAILAASWVELATLWIELLISATPAKTWLISWAWLIAAWERFLTSFSFSNTKSLTS